MADKTYTPMRIVFFAALVCVVCSLFVSSTAVTLKPRQKANETLDRQKKVLEVAGLLKPGEKISNDEITKRFADSIKPRVIVLKTGEYEEDVDATTFDQRKAAADPQMSEAAPENKSRIRRLPDDALIYHIEKDGQIRGLILPIEGYGLWGTLYGYIALSADTNTVIGITYYEHKETPGLGGEVDNPTWKALWHGRKAFGEDGKVALHVKKGPAGPPDSDPYQVDGLSGATFTSRGVTNMLGFWLGPEGFGPYLEKFRAERGAS